MRSVLVILFFVLLCKGQNRHESKLLYFAYGSNLLESRLRINVPSAVFITPAKLKGYRLDFDTYSPHWRGAPVTIYEDAEDVVWGALWAINYKDLSALDKQEGVDEGLYGYKAINVKVLNQENQEITARTYQMTRNIPKVRPEDLPLDRRPSNTYLQVIALGAYQCGLPSYYIGYINRFPTNGRSATDELSQQLGYPFNANVQMS